MPRFIEVAEKNTFEVLPMRGAVIYPTLQISFEVSDKRLLAVCEKAYREKKDLLFLCQKNPADLDPDTAGFYRVGVISRINQYIVQSDGSARLVAEGKSRAEVRYLSEREDGVMLADVISKDIHTPDENGTETEAMMKEVFDLAEEFVKYLPKPASEIVVAARSIPKPGILADFVACHLLLRFEDKQEILDEFDPLRRIEKLTKIMAHELDVMEIEMDIHKKVHQRIEENQRDYYLREQLRVLHNELDGGGDPDDEIDEYYSAIEKLHLSKEIEDKLFKEVRRLSKLPYGSAESSVIKGYLDVCLEVPWKRVTKDRIDIAAASKILERDHDGLEKVKERILEFLAVKQLNNDVKNQILCLVGPPGTGKTSIVASIAHAMKRKYVRVSLGGVRDEADIRGHRKTYIGAMPGRIIAALTQAGVRNPIILLDEIDKLTADAHGDPSSALLEVLDSEQNKAFRDHFLELPVDLSECVFIATANTLDTVPAPLIDRMEIIELKIYTRSEKLSIAQHHLLPKQLKRHGLSRHTLHLTDDAILELIDFYTREAGVRNLEREIANLCRKAAKKIIESGVKQVKIDAADVAGYLGRRKVKPDRIADEDEVGTVNGLAYTDLGGDILKIEVSAMPGSGKLELTGSLGDVMKESAHAAFSYIRAHSAALGVDGEFYKVKDVHVHVPEGAVPKDGPSAGVSIATAMVSELSGRPVRHDIAMTGEITLRGNVIPIGGLREKTMAAYKTGVKTVLIPQDNLDDLEDVDRVVREKLHFIPCRKLEDVLKNAIVGYGEGDSGKPSC